MPTDYGQPPIPLKKTKAEIIDYLEEEKFIDKVVKDLRLAGVIIGREEILAALEFAKLKARRSTFAQQIERAKICVPKLKNV